MDISICDQSFELSQEVIHQKCDKLRLLTMSNPSGSVDKRDAMRLHRNTTKIVMALHIIKKIEDIFTGLVLMILPKCNSIKFCS